jgi:hypothetical protein
MLCLLAQHFCFLLTFEIGFFGADSSFFCRSGFFSFLGFLSFLSFFASALATAVTAAVAGAIVAVTLTLAIIAVILAAAGTLTQHLLCPSNDLVAICCDYVDHAGQSSQSSYDLQYGTYNFHKRTLHSLISVFSITKTEEKSNRNFVNKL